MTTTALSFSQSEANDSMPMRLQPIDERSVWLADDLHADPAWQYTLTQQEVDELAAATARVRDRRLSVGKFTREDFPLPKLAARINALVNEVENGRGVALLRGVPVDHYSPSDLRLMYWGYGVHTGNVISQNSKGQRLAEVTDHGNDYAKPNTRGFSTNAELFPHVDTSDMTTLLCVRRAYQGGESRVVSTTAVYNTLLAEHPEYLEVLYKGFHNDLRGEGPTGSVEELTHRPVPVYSYHDGRVSCSFNLRMIEGAAKKKKVPLTPLQRDAVDCVREISLRDSHGFRFMLQPGDIQMVSNHSAFHARSDFIDHDESNKKRCLLRLWVNVHNGRSLASDFADRYNTGPRGGVAVGDGAQYVF